MTETRLPSKKTGTGRHKQEIRGADLYPTPAVLTRALLQVEPLPKLIWEPAAGMGHMSDVLRDAGHRVFSSDIQAYGTAGIFIQDFFEFKRAPQGATCICTNPPFVVASDFVRHGLDLCEKVVIFGRLAFLEASGRSDIIDNKLARVYPFVERACMMHRWSDRGDGVYEEWSGKKSTSAMAMAFYVFERHHNASKGTVLKRIWWSKPERNTRPDERQALFDLGREQGKLILT
jgi:hypothetical protein